jgi:hypothetical protein
MSSLWKNAASIFGNVLRYRSHSCAVFATSQSAGSVARTSTPGNLSMTDWKPLARPCAPVCPERALHRLDGDEVPLFGRDLLDESQLFRGRQLGVEPGDVDVEQPAPVLGGLFPLRAPGDLQADVRERGAQPPARVARAGATLSGGEEVDAAEGRDAGRRCGELEKIASAVLIAKLWMHGVPNFWLGAPNSGSNSCSPCAARSCSPGCRPARSRSRSSGRDQPART